MVAAKETRFSAVAEKWFSWDLFLLPSFSKGLSFSFPPLLELAEEPAMLGVVLAFLWRSRELCSHEFQTLLHKFLVVWFLIKARCQQRAKRFSPCFSQITFAPVKGGAVPNGRQHCNLESYKPCCEVVLVSRRLSKNKLCTAW